MRLECAFNIEAAKRSGEKEMKVNMGGDVSAILEVLAILMNDAVDAAPVSAVARIRMLTRAKRILEGKIEDLYTEMAEED